MFLSSRIAGRCFAIAFCGAALCVAPLVAQTDAPPPPPGQMQGPPPPYGGPGRGGPERHLQMLQQELSLTPDQTTQVKALLESERTKMEGLRANTTLSADDRRSQMMSIRQDENTKLRALLTPDQATKYDAMQARMRERMQHDGNGGPPPPPPPPPSPGNPQ